jgi:hypothetical protein
VREIALKLHPSFKFGKTRCISTAEDIVNIGDCVQDRTAGVRIARLENRRGLTGLAGSNPSLCGQNSNASTQTERKAFGPLRSTLESH